MSGSDAREDGARLMAAIAAGDRAAMAALMDRHARGLRGVAARYLGSEEEAEEIVQDAFLRAWRHAARYDPAKAAVSTWLYRITVNLCVDRRRRSAFRQFVGLEAAGGEEMLADPSPGAEAQLAARSQLAAARGALLRLPARQRMAILLSAVGELSTQEVAAVLETSQGSVEQLLVRARRRLREELNRAKDVTR
ncbi:MAG: sigma-70 family RNA polymerase sigma factor [Pseudomonadota bacterium]